MILANLELARRIEAAEARNGEECATAVEHVAGGSAVFAGPQSPLTQGLALGLNGPVHREELDRMETFFHAHGARPNVDLCPFADASLVEQLGQRGYHAVEFNNVLVRALAGGDTAPGDVQVRRAMAADAELWAYTVGCGFLEHHDLTAEEMEIGRHVFRMPSARCYFAFAGNRPAGAAAMTIHGGLAILFADSTVPAARGLGMQSALIAERLRIARAEGCDMATAATTPGSASQRNYERHGFQVVYTKVTVVSPARVQ